MIDKPQSNRARRLTLLTGLTFALIAAAPEPRPADPLAGYHRVWERPIPLGGDPIQLPALRAGPARQHRIVVRGRVDTGDIGIAFDGRFVATLNEEFRLPHTHLRFDPDRLVLVHSDRGAHRYVWAPGQDLTSDVRPTVRLTGLPERFRLGAARLRQVASGDLHVSLWREGPAPGGRGGRPWYLLLGIPIVLVLALGAWIAWRWRRRAPSPTPPTET